MYKPVKCNFWKFWELFSITHFLNYLTKKFRKLVPNSWQRKGIWKHFGQWPNIIFGYLLTLILLRLVIIIIFLHLKFIIWSGISYNHLVLKNRLWIAKPNKILVRILKFIPQVRLTFWSVNGSSYRSISLKEIKINLIHWVHSKSRSS